MGKQELFKLIDRINEAQISGDHYGAGEAALDFFGLLAEVAEVPESEEAVELGKMSIAQLFSDKIAEENQTGR